MGRPRNNTIYELYRNDVYIAFGTKRMIADKMGITLNCLNTRLSNQKYEGRGKFVKYDLKEVSRSIKLYSLNYGGKELGVGTIKELSEKCNFSISYLTKLSNGLYEKELIGGFRKKERATLERVG